ncbi:MAG: hypothetical protein LBD11_00540 [Candidatus Peribacteria bacterium]|nr:hypothetical protein [Candidatus Peribacteria bacterium]
MLSTAVGLSVITGFSATTGCSAGAVGLFIVGWFAGGTTLSSSLSDCLIRGGFDSVAVIGSGFTHKRLKILLMVFIPGSPSAGMFSFH